MIKILLYNIITVFLGANPEHWKSNQACCLCKPKMQSMKVWSMRTKFYSSFVLNSKLLAKNWINKPTLFWGTYSHSILFLWDRKTNSRTLQMNLTRASRASFSLLIRPSAVNTEQWDSICSSHDPTIKRLVITTLTPTVYKIHNHKRNTSLT